MVSWGEILFTVTATSYIIGRKELPRISHFIGTMTGRSIGAILRAKNDFFDATKDSDIVRLQRDFQKGIDELNDIRSELTSVGNMNRPYKPTGGENPSQSPLSSIEPSSSSADLVGQSSSIQPTRSHSSIRPSSAISGSYEGNYDNAHASLAAAEMKLSEHQGLYTSRLDHIEGGADYVSASIVDSLLLEKQKKDK